ncbi:4'-phosphopantetheinyl transferase superfamily protein [Chitinimonas viridis]|uniref:4'-phosphopantetheinyl transferase superfamily protein n=1 Tax=Chitinimonas viridis TaxID=664880 RepID=A0ABT8B7R8_9NEIS|nr:4'-phosphopantetheinyl transferase superfamily protein [Chitinimonas viridis]MDN3578302.1 4'-phosphopantetheinyl transferase superfamily protein [Chitinimonas viridis]
MSWDGARVRCRQLDIRPLDFSGVAVWHLLLDLAAPLPSAVWAELSEAEQAACLRYRQPADRLRYAITRATLRQLLGAHLGQSAGALQIQPGAHGKPVLQAGGPQFNVSHAGQHALIAISETHPVGVDVEAHDTRHPLTLLAEAYTPMEQAHCQRGEEVAAFFDVWSGKEALLKAWGVGVADHLASVTVLPQATPDYLLHWHIQPARTMQLKRLDLGMAGVSAALALDLSPP